LVLLILTAVADSKAANKRKFSCNRASKLLDKCRKGGYEIGNCVVGDGKLKKRQKKRCTKVEKKFKAQCGEYQCEQQMSQEWTPIFNSTTERYDIGDFHTKFTQHKPADKFLYLTQEVVLYNSEGTRLGLTNFMFYLNPTNGKVKFSGYRRFYLGETLMEKTCSNKVDLPYLDDANFEMITSAKSADMFQFKVSGELHTETMGDCKAFGDWQEEMKQATKMEMNLKTTKYSYLPDYFSTEFKVVN